MSYKERVGRFSDDIERYAKGEINLGEGLLRLAGESAGLVNDAIGEVTEPFVPEFVAEGLQHVVQGAMETGPAKKFLKWAEENPRAARNLTATANIGSLIGLKGFKGAGKTAKSAVDAIAHNAPNRLDGFYGNGLAGPLVSMAKGVPSTTKHAAKDFFTPSGQARSPKQAAAKKAHSGRLENVYGAKARGTKGTQLADQMGDAILNWNPSVTNANRMDALRNIGHGGLLGLYGTYGELEDL
jgi:hypothetical protein